MKKEAKLFRRIKRTKRMEDGEKRKVREKYILLLYEMFLLNLILCSMNTAD